MNTTLPPNEAAKLDALKHSAPTDAAYQPPGQATPAPAATPPPPIVIKDEKVKVGLGYWLTWPFKALLRATAMSALSVAFILLVITLAAAIGYINGSEKEMASASAAAAATAKEKDELINKFVADLPLNIKFEQGRVESYGFFRNWLWRQAKAKEFALSTTVSTSKDANTTLKGTEITQTLSSGDKFRLKPGTSDVWQLVPPPELPAPSAAK